MYCSTIPTGNALASAVLNSASPQVLRSTIDGHSGALELAFKLPARARHQQVPLSASVRGQPARPEPIAVCSPLPPQASGHDLAEHGHQRCELGPRDEAVLRHGVKIADEFVGHHDRRRGLLTGNDGHGHVLHEGRRGQQEPWRHVLLGRLRLRQAVQRHHFGRRLLHRYGPAPEGQDRGHDVYVTALIRVLGEQALLNRPNLFGNLRKLKQLKILQHLRGVDVPRGGELHLKMRRVSSRAKEARRPLQALRGELVRRQEGPYVLLLEQQPSLFHFLAGTEDVGLLRLRCFGRRFRRLLGLWCQRVRRREKVASNLDVPRPRVLVLHRARVGGLELQVGHQRVESHLHFAQVHVIKGHRVEGVEPTSHLPDEEPLGRHAFELRLRRNQIRQRSRLDALHKGTEEERHMQFRVGVRLIRRERQLEVRALVQLHSLVAIPNGNHPSHIRGAVSAQLPREQHLMRLVRDAVSTHEAVQSGRLRKRSVWRGNAGVVVRIPRELHKVQPGRSGRCALRASVLGALDHSRTPDCRARDW
eukprot:scaffold5039_cov255-Pinguiococcus_pyrenoidosus.AAC.6